MTDQTSQAHEDLAFLRRLTHSGGEAQVLFGVIYAETGFLYGLHALIGWFQIVGLFNLGGPGNLWLTVGVNLAFVLLMAWAIWRGRKASHGGVVTRAINAVFAGAGLANLAMVVVFAAAAFKTQDLLIWFLYAPVVFALQGAAWFIAFQLRRHLWLLVVALGWLAAAMLLGALWRTDAWVLATALSLFLLMGGPGLVMIRLGRKAG